MNTAVRFGLEREGRLPAGAHSFAWDGRDERGARVASGVYLASLTVDGERRTVPLVLLR